MRLRAEMEHVRAVWSRHEVVANAMVDRRLVGQVGEHDRQFVPAVPDVVERAGGRRTDECDDVRTERDERFGQV